MVREVKEGRVVETMLNRDLFFERLCRFVLIFHCHGKMYSILTWSMNSTAKINTRLYWTEIHDPQHHSDPVQQATHSRNSTINNTHARVIHNTDTVSHTSNLPNRFSSAAGIEEVISMSEVEDYSHREFLRINDLTSRELPVNARFASRCRSTVCSSGEFTIRRK